MGWRGRVVGHLPMLISVAAFMFRGGCQWLSGLTAAKDAGLRCFREVLGQALCVCSGC